MRRTTTFAIAALAVAITAFLAITLSGAPTTSATGTGPSISPGTVAGTNVPINAGASVDSWNGFNIHVHADVSGGVTLTGLTGSSTGSILTGSVFCSATGVLPEKVFGCVGLAGQSITGAGLMATFAVAATGNGCVEISLVTVPGDPTLGHVHHR